MSSSLNSISGLFKRSVVSTCLVLVGMGATLVSMPAAAEVKVGVSDWPGWVAWYVAEQKGFFKKHGLAIGGACDSRNRRHIFYGHAAQLQVGFGACCRSVKVLALRARVAHVAHLASQGASVPGGLV